MASQSEENDNRSFLERVLDEAAANAPETDHDLLAPEYRGDNVFPELPCESGMETFYDSSPPEAAKSASTTGASPTSGAAISHKSRARIFVLAITVVVLVMATLGIGLGLGLTRKRDDVSATDSSASPASSSSAIQASSSAPPSQTPDAGVHGIFKDTSIAAATFPNGDQRVFFQETSGALRLAWFSGKPKVWATPTAEEFKLVVARKHSPLSTIKWENGDNESQALILFSVGLKNDIQCTYVLPSFQSCSRDYNLTSAKHMVATDSRHLSVARLLHSTDLLMVYEYPSNQMNIMHGHDVVEGFSWRNITHDLYAMWKPWTARNNISISDGYFQIAIACTFHSVDELMCFWADSNGSISGLTASATSSRNSTVDFELLYVIGSQTSVSSTSNDSTGSVSTESFAVDDIRSSDFAVLAGGQAVWSNESGLQSDWGLVGLVPPAVFPFPYRRMATANAFNDSTSYLYHQLDDTTLAQEKWDGDNPFWLPSVNISVDTT